MSWLFFVLFSMSSCSNIGKRNYSPWQMEVSANFNLYPIVHEDMAILASNCNDSNCLKAINKYTGKTLWNWIDTNKTLGNAYYNLSPYIFSNALILPISRDLIAIDLATGKTLWHHKKEYAGESFVDGLGDKVARTYYDDTEKVHKVFLVDIPTGSMREVKRFGTPEKGKKFVRTPCLSKSKNSNDTLCIASVIEYMPGKMTKSYLSFWKLPDTSLTQDMKIYRDNKSGYGVTKQCITDKLKSYWVANDEIVCVDLQERAELWRTKMKRGMLTSRMVQDEKHLFYACEDEYLYALDKGNGNFVWKCRIAGTPSRVFTDDDILYLIGGSDGKLYMVHKETGQLVSRQKIPGHHISDGIFLRRTLFVDEDIIILNDGQKWHCYALYPGKTFKLDNALTAKERLGVYLPQFMVPFY
ncbi:MAG: PQQ-binding-like beta-propeller repeat protein [Bacteroidota bacterium]